MSTSLISARVESISREKSGKLEASGILMLWTELQAVFNNFLTTFSRNLQRLRVFSDCGFHGFFENCSWTLACGYLGCHGMQVPEQDV